MVKLTKIIFREQLIQELGSTNFDGDAADTGGFAAGQLYFFTYQAQTKQPYYDMYPLSYIIEMRSGGFLGCNLHYVKLNEREELAMSLLNNSAQGAVAVPRRTLHKYLYAGVQRSTISYSRHRMGRCGTVTH